MAKKRELSNRTMILWLGVIALALVLPYLDVVWALVYCTIRGAMGIQERCL